MKSNAPFGWSFSFTWRLLSRWVPGAGEQPGCHRMPPGRRKREAGVLRAVLGIGPAGDAPGWGGAVPSWGTPTPAGVAARRRATSGRLHGPGVRVAAGHCARSLPWSGLGAALAGARGTRGPLTGAGRGAFPWTAGLELSGLAAGSLVALLGLRPGP
jgi:hypothetical protein